MIAQSSQEPNLLPMAPKPSIDFAVEEKVWWISTRIRPLFVVREILQLPKYARVMLQFDFVSATKMPFMIRFNSDNFEFTGMDANGNKREASTVQPDIGFRLAYFQDNMNCFTPA